MSFSPTLCRYTEAAGLLLDPAAGLPAWDRAAELLYRLSSALADPLELDAQRAQRKNTVTPNGLAISPYLAGRCLREGIRSARFLQATAAAVATALERFGPPVRLLYAGCGPYAPLALPLALRLPPDQLHLQLLDLHPESLASVERLSRALGVENAIERLIRADAANYRIPPDERPHVLVSETMLRALITEPQVAITLNLAPQLQPGGLLVPECIRLEGVLADPAVELVEGARPGPGRIPLGTLFELSRESRGRIEDGSAEGRRVPLPESIPERYQILISTEIELGGGVRLGEYESSLTEPMIYPRLGPWLSGGEITCRYRLTDRPELEVRLVEE